MRHHHPCMCCGRPTRGTKLSESGARYNLCSTCVLPSPEERLLMAIFGKATRQEMGWYEPCIGEEMAYERAVSGEE